MMETVYKNKNVLITGHTGFKGSWLIKWLKILGANLYGLSNELPTEPCHFQYFSDLELVNDYRIDIRNRIDVKKAISDCSPDYIFHLAAQPIVSRAFSDPLETFETNTMGTGNILDSIREIDKKCILICITSDKCYDNVEWSYGYRETDILGGKDPYSGSKGAAELIIKSFYHSYFKSGNKVKVGIGRAGNVIGGGDWAENRIVPDIARAWSRNESLDIRSPLSTRPWQHVLEPLGGYLTLAAHLSKNDDDLSGEAFNFGPNSSQNHTVSDVADLLMNYMDGFRWIDKSKSNVNFHEAGLLKLNCDKALHFLNWRPTLDFETTISWTGDWYKSFYSDGPTEAIKCTNKQILEYMSMSLNENNIFLGKI